MSGRVAILLSSYNGARFLPEQLQSLAEQTYPDRLLLWRDDGSVDGSPAILRAFSGGVELAEPSGNLGVLGSFMALLRAAAAAPDNAFAAFCDQDDVWLPDKLARAVAALPQDRPALYCARQVLVDAALNRIGLSPGFARAPGFPAALTQNIATGCTIVLNRAAARLVAGSRPPAGALHDWWSYLLVTAAGGAVIADDAPALLYRQHGGNVVGARKSVLARALAALRRGPGPFMDDFRRHVGGLADHANLLTPAARRDVAALQAALEGGPLARLRALSMPGLRRARLTEGMVFRLWFVLG